MVHEYIEVVQQTLKELNQQKQTLVFNKVDRIDDESTKCSVQVSKCLVYIFSSRDRLSQLEEAIEQKIESKYRQVDLDIPIQTYRAVAFIHQRANVENEKYTGEYVHISCRIDEKDFKQLSKMLNTIEYGIEIR